MDYTKEIQELKKKRKKLEQQLETKGISAEERLLIRQQIIAVGQEITALYNSQAGATSAALDRVQGGCSVPGTAQESVSACTGMLCV